MGNEFSLTKIREGDTMPDPVSVFEESKRASRRILGQTIVRALSAKGFVAEYADTKEQALEAVLRIIPEGTSVGIPGSVTIREIGAFEKLGERGCRISHHWDPSMNPERRKQAWKDEAASEYYLTSSNAITYDGMLVNIDGNGNRVSAMAWADNPIVYVIGINTSSPDIQTALKRIRDHATPPNALRLHIDTPCSKVGHCSDCDASTRVCRAVLILERPTSGRRTHVIIVGEELGY